MHKHTLIEFITTWMSLFLSIIIGFILNLNIINFMFCVFGWALFILGMYIHHLSHSAHPKAHKDIKEINYIAEYGIYAWIRHPGYLGLILMFFGLAIAFGSIPTMIIAIVLSIYHYSLACKEEKQMLEKFSDAYAKYMRKVPDRFLPIRRFLRKRS